MVRHLFKQLALKTKKPSSETSDLVQSYLNSVFDKQESLTGTDFTQLENLAKTDDEKNFVLSLKAVMLGEDEIIPPDNKQIVKDIIKVTFNTEASECKSAKVDFHTLVTNANEAVSLCDSKDESYKKAWQKARLLLNLQDSLEFYKTSPEPKKLVHGVRFGFPIYETRGDGHCMLRALHYLHKNNSESLYGESYREESFLRDLKASLDPAKNYMLIADAGIKAYFEHKSYAGSESGPVVDALAVTALKTLSEKDSGKEYCVVKNLGETDGVRNFLLISSHNEEQVRMTKDQVDAYLQKNQPKALLNSGCHYQPIVLNPKAKL